MESVLQKPGAKDEFGDLMDSSVAANSSGLTIAMVLLASVVAAVVSQVSSKSHGRAIKAEYYRTCSGGLDKPLQQKLI